MEEAGKQKQGNNPEQNQKPQNPEKEIFDEEEQPEEEDEEEDFTEYRSHFAKEKPQQDSTATGGDNLADLGFDGMNVSTTKSPAKKKGGSAQARIALMTEMNYMKNYPELAAQSAEVSLPPPPTFRLLDVPTSFLKSEEIKNAAPNQIHNVTILSTKIAEAQSYIPFLYSYRSVYKAIMSNEKVASVYSNPELQSESKLNIKELTQMFKDYLDPTVRKLIQLMNFSKGVCSDIVGIATDSNYVFSEVICEKMVSLLDLMFNIDQLKLLKTGISNDLSFYRRALTAEQNQDTDMLTLPMWISSKNAIVEDLRKNFFDKAPDSTKSIRFFSDLLGYCCWAYKTRLLVPKSRNAILSTIAFVLLVHATEFPKNNIYESEHIQQVFEILHENPVIPLYGENCFVPGFSLPKMKGYVKNAPILKTVEEIEREKGKFLIAKRMKHFREIYRSALPKASSMARRGEVTIEKLYDVISALSEMTTAILRQSNFKFTVTQMTNEQEELNENGESKISKYDKCVKYNYTDEDLDALVELIWYVKTLAATTILAEPKAVQTCLNSINGAVQEYIQNTIERPLVRAKAAGDAPAVQMLESIRDIFGQWRGENPTGNLPNKTKLIERHRIAPSLAAPSAHQLDVLRVELENLILPGSHFLQRQGVFKLSHFRPKHVRQTKEFLDTCREWYYLLDIVSTVRDSSNLGFLWFRETYLDIDKKMQFPVRSSLPFILSEHLLSKPAPPELQDSVFVPLELYNDAAAQAVNEYCSQYLYKEIEAEVSLCVDMIAFSFSEAFYRAARQIAAARLLPVSHQGQLQQPLIRYSVMSQKNRMELLGAYIDFNLITADKLNNKIKGELEGYTEMLTDFRLLPFVADLFRIARMTHAILTDNHLLLDDFDILWQRATGSESPLSLDSRLTAAILGSMDLSHYRLSERTIEVKRTPHEDFQNYPSMQRQTNLFLQSPKELKISAPVPEDWARLYAQLHQGDTVALTARHVRPLPEILTDGEIATLMARLTDRAETLMLRFIEVYPPVAGTLRLLPTISKDDMVVFYSFSCDAYSAISHPMLGKLTDVLKSMGNLLVIANLIEQQMPAPHKSTSLIQPIMERFKTHILANLNIFFQEGPLDIRNSIHHRSFPSLWSILEFFMTIPDTVRIDEARSSVVPQEVLGMGPVLAAHVLINLCNREPLYRFDSICHRMLSLAKTEGAVKASKSNVSAFIQNCYQVADIVELAKLMSDPFKLQEVSE